MMTATAEAVATSPLVQHTIYKKQLSQRKDDKDNFITEFNERSPMQLQQGNRNRCQLQPTAAHC
jgi:hypothetical protein